MKQIFGWNSVDDLVREIRSSLFSELLKGYLVFAYKNNKKTGTIKKMIISKRLDCPGYMVGIIPFSKGWTGFLPNVPVQYLQEISYSDLLENKTEREVIESFVENISKYEERK